jgi:hypothetical protein
MMSITPCKHGVRSSPRERKNSGPAGPNLGVVRAGAIKPQLTAIGIAVMLVSGWLATEAGADEPASYVGGQICSGCHATQAELWKQSHHALAMQRATDTTVLGDFAGARLEHSGIVTTFSRSGNLFLVQTDGPDGVLHEYEIGYTVGVYPLQQYLIAFPGGRLQALGIAWDSRPKEQGGQRWFHLYRSQNLKAGGRLHWTGRDLELSVR